MTCKDCKRELSPVEWIVQLGREWGRVEWHREMIRKESEKLEKRQRTRCQHCHKVTGITRDAKFEIVREAKP